MHNKNRKKHWNNSILSDSNSFYLTGFIFFLIVLASIVWSIFIALNWIKNTNLVPISKLVISGDRYYTDDTNIRKAIFESGMSGTFITINLNAIQNQIKSMPWIKQVMVRKQWPDKLKIHLVEYKPYAKWNDIFFINAEGLVFHLPALLNIKKDFLMLYGPEGSQNKVLDMYFVMNNQLAPHDFSIKSVSMTVRGGWQLVLDNNIRLNIGQQDIKERLNRFIILYPLLKQVTDKRILYIDLRYANGAAVGWLPS